MSQTFEVLVQDLKGLFGERHIQGCANSVPSAFFPAMHNCLVNHALGRVSIGYPLGRYQTAYSVFSSIANGQVQLNYLK